MNNILKLNDPREAKLHNIIDMGLPFSAMMRLYNTGSKYKFRTRILIEVKKIFSAVCEEELQDIHSDFCHWGENNITLTEKKRRDGRIMQEAGPASYGQIAKTFDVVLSVAIYYCHLPNCEKSRQISGWLNAAVDTKMMALLKRHYPEAITPWPTTIKQVNNSTYIRIQETVRKFINEKHDNGITPVQFDDIYWEALNRKEA